MTKENDLKEEFFNCTKCKYKCKKELVLKKHMINKHEEHGCEKCGNKLPTSFELLLHATKHHSKKCKTCGEEFETSMNLRSHEAKEHIEEDEILNIILNNTPKLGKESKNSSFVFHESMLNEFI